MDPERLIIAHALSAAAKPYENDASLLPHNTRALNSRPIRRSVARCLSFRVH